MKMIHFLLICFFCLSAARAESSSELEKFCSEKNIDEIVTQLVQHGYDEQQILDFIDKQCIENANTDLVTGLVIAGCLGVAGTCIVCVLATGVWCYYKNFERIKNFTRKKVQNVEV